MSELIGQTIDSRYLIKKQIGAPSAYKRAYLAKRIRFNSYAAFKILHEPIVGAVISLEEEGRRMAELDHPNVVKVYDIGEFKGRPYLVEEFVSGKTPDTPADTLEELLKKQGMHFTIDEALGIAVQTADAVAYAHSKGIVHSDLKKQNILLNGDGKVKITDFGLSHIVDPIILAIEEDSALSSYSDSKRQIKEDVTVPAYDILCLGNVLLQLLPKIRVDTEKKTEVQKWENLQDIVNNARTEPDKRYRQMTDLLKDLGKITGKTYSESKTILGLQEEVTLKPFDANAHINLGAAYLEQDELGEAEQAFRNAIKTGPKDFRGYSLLGVVFSKKGEHDEAVKQIEKALKLAPENALVYEHAGIVHRGKGDLEKALHFFKKTSKLEPDNLDVCGFMGDVSLEKGLISLARTAYEKIFRLDPENTRAKEGLRMCELHDKYDKAINIWYNSELEPFGPLIQNEKAFRKKIKLLEEIHAACPDFKDVKVYLFCCYIDAIMDHKGLSFEDGSYASKAMEVVKDDSDRLYTLGECLKFWDRHKEAIFVLSKALQVEKEGTKNSAKIFRLYAELGYLFEIRVWNSFHPDTQLINAAISNYGSAIELAEREKYAINDFLPGWCIENHHINLYTNSAILHLYKKEFGVAKKILDKQEDSIEKFLALGCMYYLMKRYNEVKSVLLQIPEEKRNIDSRHYLKNTINFLLGKTLIRLREHGDAITSLENIVGGEDQSGRHFEHLYSHLYQDCLRPGVYWIYEVELDLIGTYRLNAEPKKAIRRAEKFFKEYDHYSTIDPLLKSEIAYIAYRAYVDISDFRSAGNMLKKAVSFDPANEDKKLKLKVFMSDKNKQTK